VLEEGSLRNNILEKADSRAMKEPTMAGGRTMNVDPNPSYSLRAPWPIWLRLCPVLWSIREGESDRKVQRQCIAYCCSNSDRAGRRAGVPRREEGWLKAAALAVNKRIARDKPLDLMLAVV